VPSAEGIWPHCRIADTRLVRDNQVIVVEDLNVEGMGRSARGTKEEPGATSGRRPR
jgi:transposase